MSLLGLTFSMSPAMSRQSAESSGSVLVPGSNVIFIAVDDADLSLMQYLPKTQALIADRGVTFTQYFDSLALCCPARTTYLRGQYSHNTGIWDNKWPAGGFGKFHLEGEQSTLATWLSANGYLTALMGKYLNEYPDVPESPEHGVEHTYVPAGWSEWVSPVEGRGASEFNYKLNINGVVDQEFRTRADPANYLVDTLSRMASRYVLDHSSDPYFLYVTPAAPHDPFVPAPRDRRDFVGLTYPQLPSFNEQDVSDKPSWIARRQRLTSTMIEQIDHDYRLRAQDMEAIDDLVQSIYDAVEASGQSERTYLIFTSDNGWHMGEHRLARGKETPYEEDVHLPLWISGPGIEAGTTVDEVVGDIDLAPTIAELTDTTTPDFVDGRSVLPLLQGEPTDWRRYLLLERASSSGGEIRAARGDVGTAGVRNSPGYAGLHSNRFVYVAYDNTDRTREFYDLAVDPYELTNLLGPGSPGLTALQRAALDDMVKVVATERTCAVNRVPCS